MTQGKRTARSKIGYCFLGLCLLIVFAGCWGDHVVELVADQSKTGSSVFFIRNNTSRMRMIMLVHQNAGFAQRANLAPLMEEIQSAANDNTLRIIALQQIYKGDRFVYPALLDLDKLNSEFYAAWQKQQSPDYAPSPEELSKAETMQGERFDHMRKDCTELSEITARQFKEQKDRELALFFLSCGAMFALAIFTSNLVKAEFYKRAMEEARG